MVRESPRPFSTFAGPEETRAKLGDVEFLNHRMQALLDERQFGLVPVVMRGARHLDPESSFTRLNQARIHVIAGEPHAARPLLADLLDSDRAAAARALLDQLAEAP